MTFTVEYEQEEDGRWLAEVLVARRARLRSDIRRGRGEGPGARAARARG